MLSIGWNKVKAKNYLMPCRMADESVVVIKFRPMKTGNSMEGKTETTLHKSCNGI